MPTSRSPLRLDADLLASAAAAAPAQSRSAAQQIAHWARIGRELERAPDVTARDVLDVLQGAAEYDALSARGQAVVRAAWSERAAHLRDATRLDEEFARRGARYAELDDRGRVVVRDPSDAPVAARTRAAARRRKKR